MDAVNESFKTIVYFDNVLFLKNEFTHSITIDLMQYLILVQS